MFTYTLQQQKRHPGGKVAYEQLVMDALSDLAVKNIDHRCQHGQETISDMIRLIGEESEQDRLVLYDTSKVTCYTLP